MNKWIIAAAVLAAGAAIAWSAHFYVTELSGAWTAIGPSGRDATSAIEEGDVVVPDGFSVHVYARGLDEPRVLHRDRRGNLFVSDKGRGAVYLLSENRGGAPAAARELVSALRTPHGIESRCGGEACTLYIAEEDAVRAYGYDPDDISLSRGRKILDLPEGGNHTTRTLLIASHQGRERLFVSIGSSCNVCFEDDPRRAAVIAADLDGTSSEIFATGLRNAVFMRRHPETGEIWVTEMGRDLLGDDTPPDEINTLREGGDYGWPICYGKNIHDSEFDSRQYVRNPCAEPHTRASHADIQAHSAPLGLDFFKEGQGWPPEYEGDLLVAYHGSWNRTVPTGYKLVRFSLGEDGAVLRREDFAVGWLGDEGVSWGRPVDVLIEEERILVTDDKAGVVYSITPAG